MSTLTQTEKAVLGVTSSHPADLEHIYESLHAPPRSMRLADVLDAVRSLVENDLLAAQASGDGSTTEDVSRLWKAWFEATETAKEVLRDELPSPPPGWPKERVYAGMFEGMIPDIPFEAFKENRREMSPKYSGDVDDG